MQSRRTRTHLIAIVSAAFLRFQRGIFLLLILVFAWSISLVCVFWANPSICITEIKQDRYVLVTKDMRCICDILHSISAQSCK